MEFQFIFSVWASVGNLTPQLTETQNQVGPWYGPAGRLSDREPGLTVHNKTSFTRV